jgi:uncharacterized protein with ParB-like and HNH nuclease domain
MDITPNKLSLNQLFKTSNEQFSIPAYQRRYSWKTEHTTELFEDIYYLEKEDSHYLGPVLLLTDSHKAGINALEVVDGQQRLATLTILLRAIQERYTELGDDDVSKEIDEFLYCKDVDRTRYPKVNLGDLDHPDYEKTLKQEDLEEIKNQNLLDAYENFRLWLEDLRIEEINEFYYKLTNKVIVIRLDVSQAKDAYRLFEWINDRGMSLNATDIIKNYLLGNASIIDEDTLENVKSNWKGLIINLDLINGDDFFRHYMCGILKRKVTKNSLVPVFKSYYLKKVKEAKKLTEYKKINLEDEDGEEYDEDYDDEDEEQIEPVSIVEFSKILKKASLIYSKIVNRKFDNEEINHHLYNLQRIKAVPSYIFLLDLFSRDISDGEIIEILKILETFMLRRHICEYRTGELDDIFSDLVSVEKKDIVENVRESLSEDLPSDGEFRDSFEKYDFKRNFERAKYVLEKFEYDRIGDQGEITIKSGNEVHLEHIIPQTIDTKKSKREFGDWEEYLGTNAYEEHKKYANTIGNLTLLGRKLNIVASNNPFEAKLEEYKKSTIQLTKDIVDNYTEFKFPQVRRRSKEFAKKAPEIWKF